MPDDARTCRCGCGAAVRWGTYSPGHHPRSAETRRRVSVALTGRTISAETRAKIRSDRARAAKISATLQGHVVSEATRAKIGAKARLRRRAQLAWNGCVAVYMPEHPFANSHGRVLRHRLVVEARLGRHLLPTEYVHHINGQRDDDRDENLQVVTRSEHMRIHRREQLCRAK